MQEENKIEGPINENKDLSEFSKMNTIYAEFFGDHKPARAAVEVRRLPKDVLIEIDAIAVAS